MLQLQNIYIQYGDRKLLNRVSLTIKEGDRLGLVGRNGAGKSTLLKLMAGDISPHEGQIDFPTGHTVGLLRQDIKTPEHRSVMEETLTALADILEMESRLEQINRELETRSDYESDAYAAIIQELSDLSERLHLEGGLTIEAQASRVLQGLGFSPKALDQPVSSLSGGWKMRIELAKLLLQQPTYLLLDEPTNHLDIEAILWLEEWLEDYPGAIVLISHDKTFLDKLTRRTVEVELGRLHLYQGNYSRYLIDREERATIRQSEYENQQRMIAQKEALIDKFRAKANKAKMAQSLIKELERMDRIELVERDARAMRIRFPDAPRGGAVVFKADDMSKSYGDQAVLEGIDLQIDRGDKIAFVGQNGQGKTTLARIICGEIPATAGLAEPGYNISLGYYAQDQADRLVHGTTLLETMEAASPPEMRTQLRNILGAFMFSGEDVDKKVQVLSGGERARLALAQLLLQPINLLILDEPTNHLDIISKEVLKEALRVYDGTLIVVSHDRDFLTGLTDRTVEFRDGKLYNYIGDVTAFLEKRAAASMREIELRSHQQSAKKEKATPSPAVDPKELKRAESKVMKLEEKIKTLQKEMAEEGFYDRPEAEKKLDDYRRLQEDLEQAMEAWESLVG